LDQFCFDATREDGHPANTYTLRRLKARSFTLGA